MANVLVTGGAGFIGSHLVLALVQERHAVRVIDNLSTSDMRRIQPVIGRIDFVQGDVGSRDFLDQVCRDVEYVFHLAALPSVQASLEAPVPTQMSGEVATLNLLNACVRWKIRRLIFAASASAYGDIEDLPYDESMAPRPLSPYAASKVASEHYIRVFARCYNLDSISLRFFNVFGPGQNTTSSYSGVITAFLSHLKRGEPLVIYGDGNQTRDFTYVDNVVYANLLAMRSKKALAGQVCNVGCGEEVSLSRLIAELSTALGKQITPVFAPAKIGDPIRSVASLDHAKQVLQYYPQIRFRDGLLRLIRSYYPCSQP